MGGLTANGFAFCVIAYMIVKGHADSRWGIAAIIIAALSLPMLGPVAELVQRVGSAVTPMINAIASAGAGG